MKLEVWEDFDKAEQVFQLSITREELVSVQFEECSRLLVEDSKGETSISEQLMRLVMMCHKIEEIKQ